MKECPDCGYGRQCTCGEWQGRGWPPPAKPPPPSAFSEITLANNHADPFKSVAAALSEVAGYLREARRDSARAVKDKTGEVLGYWQTPEWLQGLSEIGRECQRIADELNAVQINQKKR
jgi:hypothetical protein